MERVSCVDMFPGTGHVEVIILMTYCGGKTKMRAKPQHVVVLGGFRAKNKLKVPLLTPKNSGNIDDIGYFIRCTDKIE